MKKDQGDDYKEYEIGFDEPVYTTGVVSRITGIPVHVLKQLDERGVVKPLRKKAKARLYSMREFKKLEKCWYYMSKRKVKVDGLKVIFELEEHYSRG